MTMDERQEEAQVVIGAAEPPTSRVPFRWRSLALLLIAAAGIAAMGALKLVRPGDAGGLQGNAPHLLDTKTSESAAETTAPGISQDPSSAPLSVGRIRGVLPDGTPYEVIVEPPVAEQVTGISAAIVIDQPQGSSPVVGITRFLGGQVKRQSFAEGDLTMPAGEWTVRIKFYSHVLDDLGPDAERLIDQGITAAEVRGLPQVRLSAPFRWAADDEVPLQMQVAYETFAVRRGCGDLAAACTTTRSVQVIPLDRLVSPALAWRSADVWIESPAPRPHSDPFYLDPGPLGARGGHDVVWTGTEMIVWGGATGDRPPHLIDGAAFHPATSTWRMLSPAPFDRPQITRAVWAEAEMIVIGQDATVAYHPATDTWETIGEGVFPGLTVWTGDRIATWNASGIHQFLPTQGHWTRLPDLGYGSPERWRGALRVLEGRLYAVGLTGQTCDGRRIAEWTGSIWRLLPDVSLATPMYSDCSLANQTAPVGGRLVIWEDADHPTMGLRPGHRRLERDPHHPSGRH